MGACSRPTDLQVHPLWCVYEGHQMNCCDANGNCNQGRDCPVRKAKELLDAEDKPTPADGQLVWILWAFIVLMIGLLTLRSCL
jgi:hypothetical protein